MLGLRSTFTPAVEYLLSNFAPRWAKSCRIPIGRRAERVAERLLRKKGYSFVARNWRRPSGEIDLVFIDGRQAVFVEVKSRISRQERSAYVFEAVTREKIQRLRRLGPRFIHEHTTERVSYRFDLVGVVYEPDGIRISRVEHHVAAV